MLKGMVMLRVTSDGYVPADDEARAQHAKLEPGSLMAGKIWRSRSLPQMRLYWAVVEHVAAATGYDSAEILHLALKVRLGYYEAPRLPNGKVILCADSVAFDAMTQDEFQKYMDAAINVICAEVVPGSSREELIAEVNNMLGVPA